MLYDYEKQSACLMNSHGRVLTVCVYGGVSEQPKGLACCFVLKMGGEALHCMVPM